jgi:hypothetical protein
LCDPLGGPRHDSDPPSDRQRELVEDHRQLAAVRDIAESVAIMNRRRQGCVLVGGDAD